jgi:hypothetical protein
MEAIEGFWLAGSSLGRYGVRMVPSLTGSESDRSLVSMNLRLIVDVTWPKEQLIFWLNFRPVGFIFFHFLHIVKNETFIRFAVSRIRPSP